MNNVNAVHAPTTSTTTTTTTTKTSAKSISALFVRIELVYVLAFLLPTLLSLPSHHSNHRKGTDACIFLNPSVQGVTLALIGGFSHLFVLSGVASVWGGRYQRVNSCGLLSFFSFGLCRDGGGEVIMAMKQKTCSKTKFNSFHACKIE